MRANWSSELVQTPCRTSPSSATATAPPRFRSENMAPCSQDVRKRGQHRKGGMFDMSMHAKSSARLVTQRAHGTGRERSTQIMPKSRIHSAQTAVSRRPGEVYRGGSWDCRWDCKHQIGISIEASRQNEHTPCRGAARGARATRRPPSPVTSKDTYPPIPPAPIHSKHDVVSS